MVSFRFRVRGRDTSYLALRSFGSPTHPHPSLALPVVCHFVAQIFLTFFKTLEGKTVTVELKNDLVVRGTLQSVDQYLNLKIADVEVVDKDKFPQLVSSDDYIAWAGSEAVGYFGGTCGWCCVRYILRIPPVSSPALSP